MICGLLQLAVPATSSNGNHPHRRPVQGVVPARPGPLGGAAQGPVVCAQVMTKETCDSRRQW